MLTCITHVYSIFHEVCWLTSPMDIFELPDLNMSTHINHYLCWHISSIIYADIHHPWVQLECFIQVFRPSSPMWNLDLIKYADLHHPCIYKISWSMPTYITHGYIWIAWFKYDLCWLTSPIGTIRMLYSSMLTCITHV